MIKQKTYQEIHLTTEEVLTVYEYKKQNINISNRKTKTKK